MITISKISELEISKPSTRFGHAISVILGVATRALLILAVLLTALLYGWVFLGAALLGSGQLPVIAILAVLLAVTGGLAWLTARYFASWRRVGIVIALILALVFIVGATWALSAPKYALYYAREIAWGETTPLTTPEQSPREESTPVTTKDFLSAVNNPAPAFHFPQKPSP